MLYGRQEWEVVPGCEARVARKIRRLEKKHFDKTQTRIVVLEEDGPDGTLGEINPKTGLIILYSGERYGLGARAEELLHFQQLMERKLFGLPKERIPAYQKQEMEIEVEDRLREVGFRPKR